MPATKILWGQVLIVLGIVVATTWAATQWAAAQLGYQPQLGPPWLTVHGYRLYPPTAFFWWWFAYDAYAPEAFLRRAYVAASGGLAALDRTLSPDLVAGGARIIPEAVALRSTLICSECNARTTETMPTDACQYFYDCPACGAVLKPKAGDCCVFCSYADVACPPVQADGKGCCG